MHCPKCGCVDRVKNGKANGLPRFKCKGCGCNYTKSTRRGYALEIRKQAIALYLEGLGFRSIERLLDISHMSVMRWVRDMAQQIQSIKAAQKGESVHATIMELDEMWHYVGKKTASSGCGWLLIETPKMSSHSASVLVVEKR
jgi:transposase-like protein